MMLTSLIGAAVAAQLKIASLSAQVAEMDSLRETAELQAMQIAELESRAPEIVYVTVEKPVEKAEHRDCGMCGAHVTEWWYVTPDLGDPHPIEVCRDCYELVLDEG